MSLDVHHKTIFENDGFIVVPNVFDPEELRLMRAEADRILELLVNSSLANRRRSLRLDIRQLPDGAQVVRKVLPLVDLSLPFSQLAADVRLLGPLEELLGAEPGLIEDKLNYKQRIAAPVPGWMTKALTPDEIAVRHADDRFLRHNDWVYHRAQGYGPRSASAAVCIDDCGVDSGPLRVWPGTHIAHIEHQRVGRRTYEVPLDALGAQEGVDVPAAAGSVIFFHALLVHSSQPNVSGRPRRVVLLSYHDHSQRVPFDARNGPARFVEAPYEWNYVRLKQAGEFRDAFTMAGPLGEVADAATIASAPRASAPR